MYESGEPPVRKTSILALFWRLVWLCNKMKRVPCPSLQTYSLSEGALVELLDSLSKCDSRLPRSMHPRLQLENMLHEISEIGQRWALAIQ